LHPEAIARIAQLSPQTRVVVLSMFDDDEYVQRAQEAAVEAVVRSGCRVS